MRIYEELFILRPDASPEEAIDPFVEQLKQVITTSGGAVEKVDKWGIRRLAYRIAKRDEGYYVLLQFTSNPDAVKEVERRLRVSDLVIKFLTVRIDEKLKRLEKRRKEREKRARRKPPPAAAAPARPALEQPAPEMPGEPVAEKEL
jgi:small subunit ribosomal protein S6